MSHIDEALKRAGTPQRSTTPQNVFASAWTDQELADGVQEGRAPGVGQPSQVILTRVTSTAISTSWSERLASSKQCDPSLLEQFRRLAGTLHNAQVASGIRTVMVTSSNPGEGKTITALNLAIVLSESYRRRVLLVDADLRRPSIGDVVDVTGSVGLSAALRANADTKLSVLDLSPTLTILPAGPPDPDSLSCLTSPRMRRILDEATARFDWVILDGPPTVPLADTGQLSRMVEGTLLVVRAGVTPHDAVQKSIAAIGRDRVLGVVLNGSEPERNLKYESYYRPGALSTAIK